MQSVLSQSFLDYELIIIDSSTDSSPDIIREFHDPRIHLIQCEKTGAAKARNTGVTYARSDLVAFLDADDEWTVDHLQELYNLYKTFPDAGLFTTPYIKIRPDGSPMVMIFAGIPRPPWYGCIPRFFRTCAQGDIPVHSSSCAIRKDIFHLVAGFREDLIYGEDQDLWGRIALQYPVGFSWEGTAIYHTEAEGRVCNETHTLSGDPFSEYLKDFLKNHSLNNELSEDLNQYIQRRNKTIKVSNLLYGHTQKTGACEINTHSFYLMALRKVISFLFLMIAKAGFFSYNSRLHNTCRKIRCIIHGWYIPQYTHEYPPH